MAEKEIMILSDRLKVPDDALVLSLLGEKKEFWTRLMEHISTNYQDMSGGWNYYNDGKQWLFKMVQKKKTIFWGALLRDGFRITFYFSDKAEPLIYEGNLPERIREGFRTAPKYGLIRPVSIKVSDNEDIDHIIELITIKRKIK